MTLDLDSVPEHVKQFVIAVRRKAIRDSSYAPSSRASTVMLVITMLENLEDREKRIAVLQAITGLPITSSKLLTQGYTSVLIEEVQNVCKNFPAVLHDIERLLESRAMREPWTLFPWEAPDANMSILQQDDSPF
jgi:hypoxanthine phosphoribosyltransferase